MSPLPDKPRVAPSEPPPAPAIIERLRAICLALPQAVEEEAWVGVRWVVRKRTFADVMSVARGRLAAYARVVGRTSRMRAYLRVVVPELARLRGLPQPWVAPPWRPTIVGLVVEEHTDWVEVAELIVDSYCVQAAKRLARLVDRNP